MLDPIRFGLLATSIGVDKRMSDEIVENAADTVFGDDAGSKISRIISNQYKGDVKTSQIKTSIDELGVNLPRCPSCPDEAVCSDKCAECEKRESHLINLVREKDKMNRKLQTRVTQMMDEYSPAQKAHLEGLSEKIRKQGDLIFSLNFQLQELGTCKDMITEKDKEISSRETLLSERNDAVANLEGVIIQRDSEIYEGKKLIQETNETLEDLRSENSSYLSSIVQDHLKDLEKKDMLVKELSREKHSLESRVSDLDSRLSSIDSSNQSVVEEKRLLEEKVSTLVESMEKTSSRILALDSSIVALTQEIEKRDSNIATLNAEVGSMRNQMIESRNEIESCRSSMEEHRRLYEALEQDNESLKRSRQDEIHRVEKMKSGLDDIIASKDREISSGVDALNRSNEALESLVRSRTKEGEDELSVKVRELEERDSRVRALVLEQRGLEARIQEAERQVSSIDAERRSLDAEKKSLEGKNLELLSSMKSQSTRFEEVKGEIMTLQRTMATMQTAIDTAVLEKQGMDADVEKLHVDKSELLELFEECDEDNKKNVAHSKALEAEMTELRRIHDMVSKDHEESVADFLECDEERDRQKARIAELESERGLETQENSKKLLELTKAIAQEKEAHKKSTDYISDKLYESSISNADLKTKLSHMESYRDVEQERGRKCNEVLGEKDETIARLEGVIADMRRAADEDEVFNRATSYIKEVPGNRRPSSKYLNENYATLFWVPRTGESRYVEMRLEAGGNGKVDPVDVSAFWNQAFKNFDSPGAKKIMVSSSSPSVQSPVSVSLMDNQVYKTWLRVRKGNSCLFQPNGTSSISKIKSKEFLLWLYIIHISGLLGDIGEELIPSGVTDQDGHVPSPLSDMLEW